MQMAGEEYLSEQRTIDGMTAHEELTRTPDLCTRKRKADEAAAEDECRTKRKVEAAAAIGRPEGEEEEAGDAAANKGEDAPAKKLSRMPQEEVDSILAHVVSDSAPYYFESLKRTNPDLLPSPEEAEDEATVVLYTAARAYYAAGGRFTELQNFVREEYLKHGYVEVDEDFVARRAQVEEWNRQAKEEVLREFALSDSDEDLSRDESL